jgi:hypothetical protein
VGIQVKSVSFPAGAALGTITLIGRPAGRPHPVLDRLNRVA